MKKKEVEYFATSPGGQKINLQARGGTDEYVQSLKLQPYSLIIDKCKGLRATMDVSGAQDRCEDDLQHYYIIAFFVGRETSQGVFSGIPQSEIKCFLNYCTDTFTFLSQDKHYRRTGIISRYEVTLLYAISVHMQRVGFLSLALQRNGLCQALANFCAVRKGGDLPCKTVSDGILKIVDLGAQTAVLARDELHIHTYFKKLAKTGLLGQALRCLTKPVQDQVAMSEHLKVFDLLARCTAVLGQSIKAGTLCGDLVRDIVAGKEGFTGKRDERVTDLLKCLSKIADLVRLPETKPESCRNCGLAYLLKKAMALGMTRPEDKTNGRQLVELTMSPENDLFDSLLTCSKCKVASYCSSQCQTADWKYHKHLCLRNRKFEKQRKGEDIFFLVEFMSAHSYSIMKQIILVCYNNDVKKDEVILELDFHSQIGSCIAPALREPPEFNISLIHDYVKRPRSSLPDWFFEDLSNSELSNSAAEAFASMIMDYQSYLNDSELLVMARFPSLYNTVFRVSLGCGERKDSIFTQTSLASFERFFQHGKESELYGYFSTTEVASFKHEWEVDKLKEIKS